MLISTLRNGRAPEPSRSAALERIGPTIRWADAAVDCAFLGFLIAISLVAYVNKIGFYYDDYSVLWRMTSADDQSLLGSYHAVRPATGQRPLQALMFAALYRLFGTEALGYHLANAGLLLAIAALLYLVLRELWAPRLVCVAVPLVYSTIPHYATNRFWVDAFQINLSAACYLVSLLASLRAIRSPAPALVAWLAVALAGLVASLLSYEVVFPLFALNAALVLWAARRSAAPERVLRSARLVAGLLLLVMLSAGVAKATVVAEHGQNGYGLGFQSGLLHHVAYLVSGVLKLNVGTYLLALPYVLWWIVAHQLTTAAAVAAAVCGVIAFGYIRFLARRESSIASRDPWRALVAIGLVAFVLGYAIFVTNQYVLFRSAGIDNRVNSAAALGVAGVLVGAIGWLTSRLKRERQALVFSATLACAVAAGVFVIDTMGSSWSQAAREQRAIVSGIARATGETPRWRTLILDTVCPEDRPAVVFADQSDLQAALRMRFDDDSLDADVAAERLRATSRGLALDMDYIDHIITRTYPYAPGLVVFQPARGRLYRLRHRAAASAYLRDSRPAFECPPQRSFAWGFDPLKRWSLL